MRCGDVECAKQDVVSLSAIQPEPYTWNTGGARTSHTNYLDRSHRPTDDQDGNDDRGGLGMENSCGGLPGGSQLDDGCCVAHHNWSGTA